jgi:PAS domain-containing protein
MATSIASVLPSSKQQQQQPQQPAFEFTKRKQWADLLISELTEAIILVLGPLGQIWFCGPAVRDLLGWRDEELIGSDLLGLVNGTCPANFNRIY